MALDEAYESAFREYGIDVWSLPRDEAEQLLRESALSIELADALELWMNARVVTVGIRDPARAVEWMQEFLELIVAVDRNAARTKRRELSYPPPARDVESLRELARSLDFDTEPPRSISWLASSLAQAGDPELAREINRKAILAHPDDAMLHFDHGMLLVGQYDEQARHFQAAIAVRPETAGLWRSLGRVLGMKGDVDGALAAIQKAADLRPDHAATRCDLGRILHRAGQGQRALEELGRAVELDPKYARGHGYLALALGEAGEADEARVHADRCRELGGRVPSGWATPRPEAYQELSGESRDGSPESRREDSR